MFLRHLVAGSVLQRVPIILVSLGAIGTWGLIRWTRAETVTEQWFWIEVLYIPFGIALSVEAVVGPYERGELEPFLGRVSARTLYTVTLVPYVVVFLAGATWMGSVSAADDGGLRAVGRCVLLLGFTHLVLVIGRSRWFALVVLSVWWFLGLVYMNEWATAVEPPWVLLHPMRVAGGGPPAAALELSTLFLGLVAITGAWVCIKPERRWLH